MEQMTINENGGKQHAVAERCGALFFRALLAIARLRAHGYDVDGYEDDNYLLIPAEEHLARGMRHDFLYEIGDTEDGAEIEHLVHSCCRHLMALEMKLIELEKKESELEALRLEYGYCDKD